MLHKEIDILEVVHIGESSVPGFVDKVYVVTALIFSSLTIQ